MNPVQAGEELDGRHYVLAASPEIADAFQGEREISCHPIRESALLDDYLTFVGEAERTGRIY